MREIELKILNVSIPEITKKLLAMGAKKMGKHLVVAKHLDFSDDRIENRNDLFRLRQVGKQVELAYKLRPTKDRYFKNSEEIEVLVNDYGKLEKIIKLLGFKIISHREKYRTSFVKGDLKFELDEYPKIPPYLEIEGPKNKITQAVKTLGYKMSDTTSKAAGKVLRDYGISNKLLKF